MTTTAPKICELETQFVREQAANTPRYQRARRTAALCGILLQEFYPTNDVCRRELERAVTLQLFAANAEMIMVPEQLQHLDKASIENLLNFYASKRNAPVRSANAA